MQIKQPLLVMAISSAVYPFNPCHAEKPTAPSYSRPPMGAYAALMDDRLGVNKYQSPTWSLNKLLNTPDWLNIHLEQRTRYESKDGSFKNDTSNGDQQIDLQTDLSISASFNKFSVLTEIIDARALGTDVSPSPPPPPSNNNPANPPPPNNNNPGNTPPPSNNKPGNTAPPSNNSTSNKSLGQLPNTNTTNEVDFVQAYIAWADKQALSEDIGLEIKAGRQTLDMGSRRLISRPYFRNTVNSFTGIKIRALETDKWQFTGFAVMPVLRLPGKGGSIADGMIEFDEEANKTWLSGGALDLYKLYGSINAEMYLYNLDEDNSYNNDTRKRRYLTPGLRIYSKPKKGQLDFQAEGIGQFGTARYSAVSTQDQTHEAWSEHVEIGYSFNSTWLQRFMLEYDYASGSHNPSATSSEDNRFDPLYGTAVPDFGPAGIYGPFQRSNINSPGYKLTLTPTPAILITLQHRLIWLASASDCWGAASCAFAPNLTLNPTKNSGSNVGSQFGISSRYDFNSSVSIDGGWFHLFKDQFAKVATSTISNQDVDYFYVQSQLRF